MLVQERIVRSLILRTEIKKHVVVISKHYYMSERVR